MRIAFQMDPIERLNAASDTTLMMMRSAFLRGDEIFSYGPNHLSLEGEFIRARARGVTFSPHGQVEIGETKTLDLRADIDVVVIRQDPPFDMAYVTLTYILERLAPDTLVINDPKAIRDCPEKMLVTHFADLHPPTVITNDLEVLHDFHARHGACILKPLHGAAGAGVVRLDADDKNLAALVEIFGAINRDPVVLQAFLPAVSAGDKRIILVGGEAVGAINRVPPKGAVRSNLRVGGVAEAVTLTKRDLEICARLKPVLQEKNLIFVGIDVIGDYLTEINVTSPTGAVQLKEFSGLDATEIMWNLVSKGLLSSN